jgi:hypothetical protein
MQRKALLSIAIALTMGCATTAFAQEDGLSGVTLRVLDDVSDVEAVVLAIREEHRDGESRDGERADGERADGEAGGDHEEGDGADRADDRDDPADDEREDRERHGLEDDDHDEREGSLEDHDVEREHLDGEGEAPEPDREP